MSLSSDSSQTSITIEITDENRHHFEALGFEVHEKNQEVYESEEDMFLQTGQAFFEKLKELNAQKINLVQAHQQRLEEIRAKTEATVVQPLVQEAENHLKEQLEKVAQEHRPIREAYQYFSLHLKKRFYERDQDFKHLLNNCLKEHAGLSLDTVLEALLNFPRLVQDKLRNKERPSWPNFQSLLKGRLQSFASLTCLGRLYNDQPETVFDHDVQNKGPNVPSSFLERELDLLEAIPKTEKGSLLANLFLDMFPRPSFQYFFKPWGFEGLFFNTDDTNNIAPLESYEKILSRMKKCGFFWNLAKREERFRNYIYQLLKPIKYSDGSYQLPIDQVPKWVINLTQEQREELEPLLFPRIQDRTRLFKIKIDHEQILEVSWPQAVALSMALNEQAVSDEPLASQAVAAPSAQKVAVTPQKFSALKLRLEQIRIWNDLSDKLKGIPLENNIFSLPGLGVLQEVPEQLYNVLSRLPRNISWDDLITYGFFEAEAHLDRASEHYPSRLKSLEAAFNDFSQWSRKQGHESLVKELQALAGNIKDRVILWDYCTLYEKNILNFKIQGQSFQEAVTAGQAEIWLKKLSIAIKLGLELDPALAIAENTPSSSHAILEEPIPSSCGWFETLDNIDPVLTQNFSQKLKSLYYPRVLPVLRVGSFNASNLQSHEKNPDSQIPRLVQRLFFSCSTQEEALNFIARVPFILDRSSNRVEDLSAQYPAWLSLPRLQEQLDQLHLSFEELKTLGIFKEHDVEKTEQHIANIKKINTLLISASELSSYYQKAGGYAPWFSTFDLNKVTKDFPLLSFSTLSDAGIFERPTQEDALARLNALKPWKESFPGLRQEDYQEILQHSDRFNHSSEFLTRLKNLRPSFAFWKQQGLWSETSEQAREKIIRKVAFLKQWGAQKDEDYNTPCSEYIFSWDRPDRAALDDYLKEKSWLGSQAQRHADERFCSPSFEALLARGLFACNDKTSADRCYQTLKILTAMKAQTPEDYQTECPDWFFEQPLDFFTAASFKKFSSLGFFKATPLQGKIIQKVAPYLWGEDFADFWVFQVSEDKLKKIESIDEDFWIFDKPLGLASVKNEQDFDLELHKADIFVTAFSHTMDPKILFGIPNIEWSRHILSKATNFFQDFSQYPLKLLVHTGFFKASSDEEIEKISQRLKFLTETFPKTYQKISSRPILLEKLWEIIFPENQDHETSWSKEDVLFAQQADELDLLDDDIVQACDSKDKLFYEMYCAILSSTTEYGRRSEKIEKVIEFQAFKIAPQAIQALCQKFRPSEFEYMLFHVHNLVRSSKLSEQERNDFFDYLSSLSWLESDDSSASPSGVQSFSVYDHLYKKFKADRHSYTDSPQILEKSPRSASGAISSPRSQPSAALKSASGLTVEDAQDKADDLRSASPSLHKEHSDKALDQAEENDEDTDSDELDSYSQNKPLNASSPTRLSRYGSQNRRRSYIDRPSIESLLDGSKALQQQQQQQQSQSPVRIRPGAVRKNHPSSPLFQLPNEPHSPWPLRLLGLSVALGTVSSVAFAVLSKHTLFQLGSLGVRLWMLSAAWAIASLVGFVALWYAHRSNASSEFITVDDAEDYPLQREHTLNTI